MPMPSEWIKIPIASFLCSSSLLMYSHHPLIIIVYRSFRFLLVGMPEIIDHLHYRIVDVSTIKELSRRWYPAREKRMDDERKERVIAHR